MILRSGRRAGAAAIAAVAACYVAVSCSVYDSSLLGGGGSNSAGNATSAGSGNSGTTGQGGSGGTAGKAAVSGGSSGAQEIGGNGNEAGAAGTADDGGETGATGGANAGGGGKASAGAGAGGETGGTAGSATAGSGGGSAGSPAAGSGGASAGAGGAPPATGCAKLTVPLDDASDRAHFVITLPANTDMSTAGGTVSTRLYVAAGTGGTVFNYVQDPSFHFFGVTTALRPLISSFTGWSVLSWDVGAQADSENTGIQKNTIKRVGIEVNSAPSTAWTNPTVIYIDSIVVTTPTVTYTYNLDTSATVLSAGTTTDPTGTVLWFNNGSQDTKATGVTLTWQATCP